MNPMRLVFLTAVLLMSVNGLYAHPTGRSEARAPMQEVTSERMQRAILAYVRSRKDETVADVQVRLLEPEQSLVLPGGLLGIRISPIPAVEEYGRREFEIALSVHGKLIHTVKASADIVALVDVAVATKLIKADQTIEADDVTMSRIPVTTDIRQYALDLDEIIGKRAARPLAPRMPISPAALGQPYLVRKGDRVTIEVKRGRLQIQTVGIMKAVGQMGQTVTVTNQDSGKDLRAKVIGPGLVGVDF